MYIFVVAIIYYGVAVFEKLEFLVYFLFARLEVALVGCSNVCEYSDGGADNLFESFHFARLRDSCFKNCKFCVLFEQPYRQRNANLRVVALGASCDVEVWA